MGESTRGAAGPVLLFDGECGLCNGCVRLLLRIDTKKILRFGRLQDPPAQAFLRTHGLPADDFDSLVYVPDWAARDRPDFLLRTDGVVAALRSCGPMGRLIAGISIVPTRWRDAAYRIIARYRHRIFGPWKPRPLGRPEWESRFIR